MLQLPKIAPKGPLARKYAQRRSIIHIHALFMTILGESEVQYRLFTTIWTNVCDTKPEWTICRINLYSCQRCCDNARVPCASGSKQPIQVIRSHRSGYEWLWCAEWLQWCSYVGQWGMLWVHIGDNMKTWRFCSCIWQFWRKNTVFTCLLSSGIWDSLPKYIDMALAPTMSLGRGVERQFFGA